MSTVQTITTTTFYPRIRINNGILHCEPAEVVDMALERLQRAGLVMIMEWQALLYRRMNVPVLVKVKVCIYIS
jgi:hypothetical protein